jgi:hypothetical protein
MVVAGEAGHTHKVLIRRSKTPLCDHLLDTVTLGAYNRYRRRHRVNDGLSGAKGQFMDEKIVDVQLPDGTTAKGVEVQVLESTERWSEVSLADGTVLRMKLTLASAIRVIGKFDQEGNPLYIAKGAPVTGIVKIDDKLRQKN